MLTRFISDLDLDQLDLETILENPELLEQSTPSDLLQIFKNFLANLLPMLGWALLVLVLGYLVARVLTGILRTLLKRSKVDPGLHSFILAAFRIVLLTLVVITAMGVLGIPLTPLITAMSAIGLALSLAVKDTLSNIAGGISVIFARPFGKGDYVDIGSTSGTIREMGLVYTQLRTVDNKHIYLPNGDVSGATIVNYSREGQRRLDLYFQLRAGADVDTARKLIADAVRGCPLALDQPAPIIRVVDHSYALLKFCCNVWVNKENMADLKDYLITTVRDRLIAAGIDPVIPAIEAHHGAKRPEQGESPRPGEG